MNDTPTVDTLPASEILKRYVTWAKADLASGGMRGREARVVADYLRHLICRLGVDEGKAGAVHVQKLLTTVRDQLGWLVPPTDEPPWAEQDDQADEEPGEVTRTVKGLVALSLERLVLIGDCGKQGKGYYIPAPVRCVVLGSGRSIVLGGLDTASVARHSGGAIGWAGLARTVENPNLVLPRLSVQDWLGTPPDPLPEWTRAVFARAEKSLQPSPGRDGSEFEIYNPLPLCRFGQSNRWSYPRQWAPSQGGNGRLPALHLCRTKRRPRRFWLSPLEQTAGEATFRAEAAIPREESRRLMYGIDLVLGCPTRAEVIDRGASEVEFRLRSWLPSEEYRLLTALSHLSQNAPDTPLPYCFHVSSGLWPDAAAALTGLGILLPGTREFKPEQPSIIRRGFA